MMAASPAISPVDVLSQIRFGRVFISGHDYHVSVVRDMRTFDQPPNSIVIPILKQEEPSALVLVLHAAWDQVEPA